MIMSYIGLALSLSFVIAVVPFGLLPSKLEFWFVLGVFGIPLVITSWPVYVRLLKRETIPFLLKPVMGACLFPIPAAMLQLGYGVVNGDVVVNPIRFFWSFYFFVPIWYILFGCALGMLLAFDQWSTRRPPRFE
jgi:hypothetical protein